jgi:hypothetical protein
MEVTTDHALTSMDKVKEKFSQYLNDELDGKSDLAAPIGALSDSVR